MGPIDCGSREDAVVEHRHVRSGRLEPVRDAPRQGAAKQAHGGRHERSEQASAGQAVAILRIGEPDSKPRLRLSQVAEHARGERARNRPIDQAITTDRPGDLVSVPLALDVGMQSNLHGCEKAERVIEGGQVGRDLSQLLEPEPADAARSYAMAYLEKVVRVGEHKRAVDKVENVELDKVDVKLECPSERRQCVLWCKGSGSPVADPQEPLTATKLGQVLRMTTTAQSSVRSPPVKARQSSTTARASSAAGSKAWAASRASSRSSP